MNRPSPLRFDAAGNTIKRTDARNWPTTYTLDALNRTTGALYIDGTRVTNTFDAAGQPITTQDVTGVTTYLWDNAGRQTGVTNGAGYRLTYTLDRNGNRTVMVDPDGGKTTFTWDRGDRLSTIANPWGERTTIAYDNLDRELKKTLGNGAQVSHLYDSAGREQALWNVSPAGVGLAIFTQTFDAVGNPLSSQELDGTRVTWSYDASDELINEQRSGVNGYNTTYSYDGRMNRTVKNDSGQLTAYGYNAASELTLLTPPTGQPTTSAYDANGNLLSENTGGQVTTYGWESENRLTGIAYPTGAPDTMAYDASGLRQKKVTADGTVTNFVWDQVNVLQEKDSSKVTQAQYTDDPGAWGGLVSQRRSGASSYFGFDQQGSTRILETSAGAQSDGYTYRAFGDEVASTGSTVNPLRFIGVLGYYRDAATRLYVRARQLRPDLGRWLSRDPLFESGDEMQYVYVVNSPLDAWDASGKQCHCCTRPDYLPGKSPMPSSAPKKCVPKTEPNFDYNCKLYRCLALCICWGHAPKVCRDYFPDRKWAWPDCGTRPGARQTNAVTSCLQTADPNNPCRGVIERVDLPGVGSFGKLGGCRQQCTIEHEAKHQRNCERNDPNHCVGVTSNNAKPRQRDECDGWNAGAECMEREFGRKRGGCIPPLDRRRGPSPSESGHVVAR